MNMSILVIIGVAVLAVSTIGFGASLSTTPAFNRIGGSDNNVVNAARGNVTALVWTEEVAADGKVETDLITFSVGNEHTSAAHTFQVCAVIEGPSGTYSPVAGAPPECVTTSSIAANAILTGQIINFATAVNVLDIVDISFSIEELS